MASTSSQHIEAEEICRVCRCPAEPESPLFHPCKCSGSMKYVHQDCLEEWLTHSKKKHCEICNHQFIFSPIYSESTPQQISIWFFLSVVLQKTLKLSTFYFRVLLSGIVWLVLLPYLTVWIWRFYFNPFDVFKRVSSSEEPEFQKMNWPQTLQDFFTDVFEGQLLWSVAVVVGLAFLLIKEYIVMNTPVDANGNPTIPPEDLIDNIAIPNEAAEIPPQNAAPQNPPPMVFPENPPPNDFPQDPPFEDILRNQRLNIVAQNPTSTAAAPPPQSPALLWQPQSPEQHNIPLLEAARREQDMKIAQLRQNYDELRQIRPRSPARLEDIFPNSEQRSEAISISQLKPPLKRKSFESYTRAGLDYTDELSTSAESTRDDFFSSKVPLQVMDGLSEDGTHPYDYFEEEMPRIRSPRRSRSHDEVSSDKFSISPFSNAEKSDYNNVDFDKEVDGVNNKYGMQSLHSYSKNLNDDEKIKESRDSEDLEYGSNGSYGDEYDRFNDSESNDEEDDGNMGDDDTESDADDSDDEENNQPLIDIDINLEVGIPNNNLNPPLNNNQLDVNINLEINNGGVNAEINGDVNAFMELIGVHGPIETLFTNAAIMLLIMIMAIGLGVTVPYITGRLVVWVGKPVVVPIAEGVDKSLDLVVDVIVNMLKEWMGTDSKADISTAKSLANATVAEMVNFTQIAPNQSLENATQAIGEKVSELVTSDPKMLSSILDTLTYILIGYAVYLVAGTIYAKNKGYLEHPYCYTCRRLLKSWGSSSIVAFKFTLLIVIELILFPIFCGILIDICTLPIFGPNTTLLSRYNFYVQHPWTSRFLHWVAGTTFMYQFAVYVSVLREVLRPGVMWFVSDDKDGQFMNEFLQKPILTQLRKFLIGTVMYAILILSGVGGFVMSLYIVQWGAKSGARKILPLKWELSDSISEFPIDLLLFHFIVPWTIHASKPGAVFKYLLSNWFDFTARMFRLTSFLLGGRHPEEESEDEADEVEGWAGHNPGSRSRESRRHRHNHRRVPEPAEGVENDEESSHNEAENRVKEDIETSAATSAPNVDAAPNEGEASAKTSQSPNNGVKMQQDLPKRRYPKSNREKRFLRVPNHDRIKIIPKVPVMIPMRANEPLFGRPDETPEDVRNNWTKVYVPANLRGRIYLLMLWHWISGLALALLVIVAPLILGRISFNHVHRMLAHSDPAAAAVAIAARTGVRADLPVHDIYSWSVGMFMMVMAARPIIFIIRWMYGKHIFSLKARRSVGQQRNRRRDNRNEHARRAENPAVEIDIARQISRYLIIGLKLLFLLFWLGVVIPMLLGTLFQLYVILPIKSGREQTSILFILQDWALGAVYTKIIHMFVSIGPDSEIKRVFSRFNEALVRDVGRIETKRMFFIVILPTVLFSLGAMLIPTSISHVISLTLPGIVEDESLNFVNRYIYPFCLLLFFIFEFLGMGARFVKRWMDQVRDEHYLVGRKLHNLNLPQTVDTEMDEKTQRLRRRMKGKGRAEEAEVVESENNLQDEPNRNS